MNKQEDRNQEATVYMVSTLSPSPAHLSRLTPRLPQGNLDERCTDALIWELMLQAGPVGKQNLDLAKTRGRDRCRVRADPTAFCAEQSTSTSPRIASA